MRCIWQMDGDKVKGFKCELSPVDMLIVVSGLKYITADIERHPKDRERAQYIYNKIMLSRYEDEPQGDDIIVRSNLYPFRVAEQTEPKTERQYDDVWGMYMDEHDDYEPQTEPKGVNYSDHTDYEGAVNYVTYTDCPWK